MPTFTRILNVFEDILREDPLYEVVSTSHGYTLLAWDEHRHQWYNAELMETPDAMLDALLGVYASYRKQGGIAWYIVRRCGQHRSTDATTTTL